MNTKAVANSRHFGEAGVPSPAPDGGGTPSIPDFATASTKRLTEQDYGRDAVTMAKALLGRVLCRRLDDGTVLRARIVETEAYFGEEDTACHAHKGRTPRTDVMYAPGGHAYIYLCYGMHNLLNVVTGPADHPEAVLIRGVEGAIGPGRVTKMLQVTRALNRENLVASERLWIEEGDGAKHRFKSSPRVGIGYASPRDQARKWRFQMDCPKQERLRLKFGRICAIMCAAKDTEAE